MSQRGQLQEARQELQNVRPRALRAYRVSHWRCSTGATTSTMRWAAAKIQEIGKKRERTHDEYRLLESDSLIWDDTAHSHERCAVEHEAVAG
jgi:hypothetical protein